MKLPHINITKTLSKVGAILSDKMPEILIGSAIAGVLGVVLSAGSGTIKACEIVREMDEEAQKDKKEVIKATWKCYIPAAVFTVGTIASVLGAYGVQKKRLANLSVVLTTALNEAMDENGKLRKYLTKEEEKAFDERKESDILNNAIEQADGNIPVIDGQYLAVDSLTGAVFRTSINKILEHRNNFQRELLDAYSLSVNEWLIELGLDTIGLGDIVGWAGGTTFDVEIKTKISQTGEPAYLICYKEDPSVDYREIY